MFLLNQQKSSNEAHQCESRQRGDWIIFRCLQCDYVRKINYKTKKMKSQGGDHSVIHHGVSNSTSGEWGQKGWN